jgi:hypothetical protein
MMSGGSYNYLFTKDVEDIFYQEEELQRMADRLAELGYASDAAAETMEVLLEMRRFMNRLQTRLRALSDVWHAVEWWDSGDGGEDGLKRALSEYRGDD